MTRHAHAIARRAAATLPSLPRERRFIDFVIADYAVFSSRFAADFTPFSFIIAAASIDAIFTYRAASS